MGILYGMLGPGRHGSCNINDRFSLVVSFRVVLHILWLVPFFLRNCVIVPCPFSFFASVSFWNYFPPHCTLFFWVYFSRWLVFLFLVFVLLSLRRSPVWNVLRNLVFGSLVACLDLGCVCRSSVLVESSISRLCGILVCCASCTAVLI